MCFFSPAMVFGTYSRSPKFMLTLFNLSGIIPEKVTTPCNISCICTVLAARAWNRIVGESTLRCSLSFEISSQQKCLYWCRIANSSSLIQNSRPTSKESLFWSVSWCLSIAFLVHMARRFWVLLSVLLTLCDSFIYIAILLENAAFCATAILFLFW